MSSYTLSCPQAQKDRTLFVTNVPPHFDFSDLVQIFSVFGEVEMAMVQDQETAEGQKQISRRSAHVVFEEEESMTNALSIDGENAIQPYVSGSGATGIASELMLSHLRRFI